MDQLGRFLASIKPRFDDDGVDRLNYYYTTALVLLFSLTLSAKQYVGQPIQCWVPAQFKGNWEKYTEDYCFVENTYWLNMYDKIPDDPKVRDGLEISYYQWVPFVLAIQAVMFHLPHVLWQLLNWQSGLNVRAIVTMACEAKDIGAKNRGDSVTTIANHINDACSLQKTIGREVNPFMWFFGFGKAKGLYVTLLYHVIKLLFIVNLIGQFFILNSFIGSDYKFWGAQMLSDISKGREWENSGHFPRVTLCDLRVRELGNMHRWTVQCVLMINMFNEKIYIFLWWWFLMVTIITVVNFFWWILQSITRNKRVAFVRKYYQASKSLESKDAPPKPMTRDERESVRHFVRSKLKPDGVFVLRLIASNAGDVITAEIIHKMYVNYLAEMSPKLPPKPKLAVGNDEEKKALEKEAALENNNVA